MSKRVKRLVRAKLSRQNTRHVLVISRSNQHIYAQLKTPGHLGKVVGGVSSLTPSLRAKLKGLGSNKAAAYEVGQAFAAMLKEKGITTVVVDRGGCLFWGRVRSLVQGVTDAGIII